MLPARRNKVQENWHSKIIEWRFEPCKFVYEALGVEKMEPFQEEAFNELFIGGGRVSIRSGHGVGKTALMAWAPIFMVVCYFPCKVGVVANTRDQLRDVTWSEVGLWFRRLPKALRERYEYNTERLYLADAPEECFASARTGSIEKPEALQGLHSDNMLFVLEEVSAIPDIVFEVAEGALSSENSRVIMAGNPTRVSGYFFDSHHEDRDMWWTKKVSCFDSSRVSKSYIDRMARKYGEDSNVYKIRVLGEFATASEQAVIPLAWIEDAINREVEPYGNAPVVWGLDPSRFGDDETALAKRQGNVLLGKVKAWKGREAPALVGKIVNEYMEDMKKGLAPERIMVDSIGLGGPIKDYLQQEGLPVKGVNVAEAASAVDEKYQRLRDELWFKGRDWFAARDCKIPDDRELTAELSSVEYDFTPSGKIWVQGKRRRKEDTMSPLGFSPNRADAFLLTLAVPRSFTKGRKRQIKYNYVGLV